MLRSSIITKMPLNQWLSTEEFQQFADGNQEYHWLVDTGSMTLALNAAGNNPLVVNVLSSEKQSVAEQECSVLNIPLKSRAFVRE